MELISQLGAVVAVLALAGGMTWLMKRGGWVRGRPGRPDGTVEVIQRVALTPQVSIHLVRIRSSEIVVAVHGTGVTVLDGLGEGSHMVRRAGAG